MSRFRIAIAATLSLLVVATALPATALPATAQPAASGVTQVTGKRLATALLPTSWFARSSVISLHSAWNSGGKLEHGPATYNVATMSCADLYWARTGFGETASAGDNVLAGNLTTGQGAFFYYFGQFIYQFASPADAAAFFHASYRDYGRCRSAAFTIDSVSQRTVTQHITAGHMGKYQAFSIDQLRIVRYPSSPNPIYYRSLGRYVLAGTDVYCVSPSFLSGQRPLSYPPDPTAASIASALIARVKAL